MKNVQTLSASYVSSWVIGKKSNDKQRLLLDESKRSVVWREYKWDSQMVCFGKI